MSNKETISIPKNRVVQAGNALGIKANRLANYFGFSEGFEKVMPEEDWVDVLSVLLEPLNFASIMVLFEDDSLLLTNALTGEADSVFCGAEDVNLMVLPMSHMEMVEQLASYLGEVEIPSKIKQELSLNALIAILAIVDSFRRAKLKNVLDPRITEFDLNLESLSRELEDAVGANDLRWLAPFMQELRWETKEIDLDSALNEIAKLGIIQYRNKKIEIDEKGLDLFGEMVNRKTMLGIRSVFYHEGVLNYLSLAFLRTENFLWYLDGAEKACLMTLNSEELKGMIAMIIAPGEIPPDTGATPARKVEDKKEASGPRFCRNCGEKLSEEARFCKKCGSKIN